MPERFSPKLKWLSIIAIIGNMKVSVADAKNTLPKLIKAVEDGESVTIYRHGTPVVDIVRTTKADPEPPFAFGAPHCSSSLVSSGVWWSVTSRPTPLQMTRAYISSSARRRRGRGHSAAPAV